MVVTLVYPLGGWQLADAAQMPETALEVRQENEVEVQETPATQVDQDTEVTVQIQVSAINRELSKVIQFLEIDDAELLARIKDSLQDDIEIFEQRIKAVKVSFIAPPRSLVTELFDALSKKCTRQIPQEKQEALTLYLNQEVQRRNLQTKNGQNSLISYLDSHLCLSSEQREELKSLLDEEWQHGCIDLAGPIFFNSMGLATSLIDSGIMKEFESVLTEPQYAFLSQMDDQLKLMLSNAETGDDQFWESALALKVLEYERIFGGLSDKQKRVLDVAGKGTVGQVTADWQKLFDNSRNDGMDMKIFERMAEPMVQQCIRQPVWTKTLRKIFSTEQLEKIGAVEYQRKKFARKTVVTFVLLMMTEQAPGLSLSFDQHAQLRDLFIENCRENESLDYVSVVLNVLQIKDRQFKLILTDEQWPQFTTMVKNVRSSFKHLQDKTEESDQ